MHQASPNASFAHAMKFSYSFIEKLFETEIAHRPSRGTGIALRFSTCFTPARMSIAYGPVQVKALVIIANKQIAN